MVKIYKLIDPRDSRTFYVGKTKTSLKDRLKHHIYESKKKKRTEKHKLILEILDSGQNPIIKTVKRIKNNTKQRWQDIERYYISKYPNLLNIAPGGGGCGEISKETRLKMSKASKGRKLSKEQRKAISIRLTGVPLSKKHKKALKKNHRGNTGRKFTEEHKANLRKALTGIKKPKWTEERHYNYSGANHPNSQRVKGVNTTTGEVLYYNSTGEAFRDLKAKGIRISRASIIKNLKDESLSAGGYKWYKI